MASWDTVRVSRLQNPAGEGQCCFEKEHVLFMPLGSRPIFYVQQQDGKTNQGLQHRGDLLITPAKTPLYVRWEGEEDCLQIRLQAEFLQRVAQETLEEDGDRLALIPSFQVRNGEIETIATMLLQESQREARSSLYVDSLTHVLAVNLLRQHSTTKPQLPVYEGGLPQGQLRRVLDYVDAHLEHEISLAALAGLLEMSPFHFSRLFKQSLGISPHQYLIQQRVERAKRLLKQSERLIVDIALDCGFSSHSHLSQQFRKRTGVTPKAYRLG